jgi:3-methyl-2-oxobutanoate hydroxymethyltransferase
LKILSKYENFNPKFLKKYANISDITKKAINNYSKEVRENKFPSRDNIFE